MKYEGPLRLVRWLAQTLVWALLAWPDALSARERSPRGSTLPTAARSSHELQAATNPQRVLPMLEAAIQARDFDGARALLEQAMKQQAQPYLLFQLGRLAMLRGQRLQALDFWRRFVADPASQPDRQMLEQIRHSFAKDRPSHGEVDLLASDGSWVFVDDLLLGSLPLHAPLMLPPGRHTLRVEQRGHRMSGPVDVLPGRLLQVRFNEESQAMLLTTPARARIVSRLVDSDLAHADPLMRAVVRAVRRTGLVPLRETLDSSDPGTTCEAQVHCLLAQARQQGSEHVLLLQRVDDGGQSASVGSLQITHIDVQAAEEAAQTRIPWPSGSPDDMQSRLLSAVEEVLLRGLNRARGSLQIRSSPVGAIAYRGALALGRTPYSMPAFAGSQRVRIEAADYEAASADLAIAEGQTTVWDVTLRRLPFVQRRPLWRLITGGVLIAGGGLMIGFGASALAIRDVCIQEPPMGVLCREYYGTLAPGIGLLSAGSLATALGVVLIAVPRRGSRR